MVQDSTAQGALPFSISPEGSANHAEPVSTANCRHRRVCITCPNPPSRTETKYHLARVFHKGSGKPTSLRIREYFASIGKLRNHFLERQPLDIHDLESPTSLRRIYAHRFSESELANKQILWRVLCSEVFQRYVPENGAVLDLGAGYCEFINNISAKRRIAVDLNPELRTFAEVDVEVINSDSRSMKTVEASSVDTVFTSNFFEHLPNPEALLETLTESRRVLKPGGTIVVLMPNIRNLPGKYWDFLDHRLALTHRSLIEALNLTGFRPILVRSRFLPYTVNDSRLPVRSGTVWLYLKLRPLWWLLGKQMLVVAKAS